MEEDEAGGPFTFDDLLLESGYLTDNHVALDEAEQRLQAACNEHSELLDAILAKADDIEERYSGSQPLTVQAAATTSSSATASSAAVAAVATSSADTSVAPGDDDGTTGHQHHHEQSPPLPQSAPGTAGKTDWRRNESKTVQAFVNALNTQMSSREVRPRVSGRVSRDLFHNLDKPPKPKKRKTSHHSKGIAEVSDGGESGDSYATKPRTCRNPTSSCTKALQASSPRIDRKQLRQKDKHGRTQRQPSHFTDEEESGVSQGGGGDDADWETDEEIPANERLSAGFPPHSGTFDAKSTGKRNGAKTKVGKGAKWKQTSFGGGAAGGDRNGQPKLARNPRRAHAVRHASTTEVMQRLQYSPILTKRRGGGMTLTYPTVDGFIQFDENDEYAKLYRAGHLRGFVGGQPVDDLDGFCDFASECVSAFFLRLISGMTDHAPIYLTSNVHSDVSTQDTDEFDVEAFIVHQPQPVSSIMMFVYDKLKLAQLDLPYRLKFALGGSAAAKKVAMALQRKKKK